MEMAVNRYFTAGLAIVGASVVAVAPITPPINEPAAAPVPPSSRSPPPPASRSGTN